MAVVVQMDSDGATLAQYDEICGKMGLSRRDRDRRGAISHFATTTDSGLRVVDVWETKMQFFEVHNYFTPGS